MNAENSDNLKNYYSNQKKLIIFILIFLGVMTVGTIYLWKIVVPFFLGIILAFLMDPAIETLEKLKIKRTWGVLLLTICILLIVAYFLLFVIPNLIVQISLITQKIPAMFNENEWLQVKIAKILHEFSVPISQSEVIHTITSHLVSVISMSLNSAISILTSGIKIAETLVITLITFFYCLKEKQAIKKTIKFYIPESKKESVHNLSQKILLQINKFIKGSVLVSFIIFLFMLTLLHIFKSPVATSLAIFSGVISIIPYIGPMLQVSVILIVQLLNAVPISHVLWIVFIQGIFYSIVGFYLHPTIVGKTSQIHPLIIIACIVIGGNLSGVFGMLLSIPVFIVLKTIFITLFEKYKTDHTLL